MNDTHPFDAQYSGRPGSNFTGDDHREQWLFFFTNDWGVSATIENDGRWTVERLRDGSPHGEPAVGQTVGQVNTILAEIATRQPAFARRPPNAATAPNPHRRT